jgi:DNA primase
MSIPQTFIQDLLARVDIVDVVGKHVQLKKGGANFVGLCPFHNEKSPSFSVSPTKQFFHCFGCGKTGNAVGFLMEHTGMHFVEAVKDLAQSYGLVVPETDFSPEERLKAVETQKKQHSIVDLLETACASYKKNLKDSPKAINYLKHRGLSGEIAKQFGLGYALDEWTALAHVYENYTAPTLVEAGLVIEHNEDPAQAKRYDRFRDRIMFPIRNIKGECIGFGGRVMGDAMPKYLNSPETPVFSKGKELYGLFEARQHLKEKGHAIVTEGYMDVVALAQLGVPNAVATLGTACTPDHISKLFRFTDTIVFSFDGDQAGRRAAKKALEVSLPFAKDTRSLKFLFLPQEHDPDSYIRAMGVDAFSRLVSSATPLSQFLLDIARNGCDLSTAEGRSMLAAQAKPMWSALPQGVLQTQLLNEIADLVHIGHFELKQLWSDAPPQNTNVAAKNPFANKRSKQTPWGANARQDLGQRRTSIRQAPMSRQDRGIQILFQHMTQWAAISSEQQSILCLLPAPHGLAFTWLERQFNEFGAMSWLQLKEMVPTQAWSDWLIALVNSTPLEAEEGNGELKNILFELEKADVSEKLTQMAPLVASDPQIYKQFKSLSARLALLKSTPLV